MVKVGRVFFTPHDLEACSCPAWLNMFVASTIVYCLCITVHNINHNKCLFNQVEIISSYIIEGDKELRGIRKPFWAFIRVFIY